MQDAGGVHTVHFDMQRRETLRAGQYDPDFLSESWLAAIEALGVDEFPKRELKVQ